ncbi:MAG TPA: hypothetical protein VGG99_12100 [Acetobacteraceae bacterium]|jgi:hypothetical protein
MSASRHRIGAIGLALGALLAMAPHARAFPSLVTLHDVTFSDGGTATGSFALNVSGFLNTPTSITTTAGSVLGGNSYDLSGPFSKTSTTVFLTVPSPPAAGDYEEGLNLTFALPLGSVEFDPIVTGVSCEYTGYVCSGPAYRYVVSGYAQIFEPGSAAVLCSAIFGLGTVRRRFNRRTA